MERRKSGGFSISHRLALPIDDFTFHEMGSLKDLTAGQIAHMNELTRDLTEREKAMRRGPTGTIEFPVRMNSNYFVLIELKRSLGSN